MVFPDGKRAVTVVEDCAGSQARPSPSSTSASAAALDGGESAAARRDDELVALASILAPDEFEVLGGGGGGGVGDGAGAGMGAERCGRGRDGVDDGGDDGASSSRQQHTTTDDIAARVQLRLPINFGTARKVRILSCCFGSCANSSPSPSDALASGSRPGGGAAGRSEVTTTVLEVQHLPPLTLRIALPRGYPATDAPVVEAVDALWLCSGDGSDRAAGRSVNGVEVSKPSTLTSADWIRNRLANIWDETQAEVLWLWADWVWEGLWDEVGEAVADRDGWRPPWATTAAPPGEGGIDLFEVRTSRSAPALADMLHAYNTSAENSVFEDETFSCSICLEDRKGRRCTRVAGCGHVFCSECLTEYVKVAMGEGVTEIRCPDPECTKTTNGNGVPDDDNGHAGGDATDQQQQGAKTVMTDSELALLVGQEMFTRFAALRKRTLAEADPSAAYCPVIGCGGVVLGRKEDEGTAFEALRECHLCGFAFCRWCGKAWHGKTTCELSAVSRLATAWLSAAPDSEERAVLIRQVGQANILRLVKQYEEERANRAWLSARTTPCPHCSTSVEKSSGCNHLTCARCGMHFCFLCGQRLNPARPYAHFNTPGLACYQRLFEGLLREPVDGADADGLDGGGGGHDGADQQDFWVGPEDMDGDDGVPWAAIFAT